MPNVLAFTEQRDGTLRRVSTEVVTAARTVADGIGGAVDALLLGPAGVEAQAAELGRYGAERVLVGESDVFGSYDPEAFTAAVVAQVQGKACFAVLFPASSVGKDLAARVAARLDVPLAADATGLVVEGGELVVTRPVYGGRAFATLTLAAEPRLVSVRSNVVRAEERPRQPAVERIDVSGIQPGRVRIRSVEAAGGEKLDVAEAPVVVSGGRGMREPDNWKLLEQLCEALGPQCALGASRAVVDAGWRPHAEQVGQTGKTVSPQLYIAVGISGAMQHLAGMRSAKTIVAINKDADAPIFKVADYGIVGDAMEIVPRLTKELAGG